VETVEGTGVHAARWFASIEFSFVTSQLSGCQFLT